MRVLGLLNEGITDFIADELVACFLHPKSRALIRFNFPLTFPCFLAPADSLLCFEANNAEGGS